MIKDRLRQIKLRWKYRRHSVIGRGVLLSPDIELTGKTVIGDGATLEAGVVLSGGVRIGSHAWLSRITVGQNSFIEAGVICTGYGSGRIVIGRECYIGIRDILDWSDNITIGDFVHIAGPSTGLWTHTSSPMCLHGIPLADQGNKRFRPTKPIMIGDNVYIGGNCTIYPGVTIDHHSVITPNSAVTEDIPPYSIAGGVPAKVIKEIRMRPK